MFVLSKSPLLCQSPDGKTIQKILMSYNVQKTMGHCAFETALSTLRHFPNKDDSVRFMWKYEMRTLAWSTEATLFCIEWHALVSKSALF